MKRQRKNGNILIDLTALLDVVFIVLLIIICKLNADKMELDTQSKALTGREAELGAKQSLYEDQLDSIQNIADYVVMISVRASFDPDDIMTRNILVLNSDKSSRVPELETLKGPNEEAGYDGLREYLEDYIADNPDKTIVLSLNEQDEDILYRDEKKLTNILAELAGEHSGNIRIKGVK